MAELTIPVTASTAACVSHAEHSSNEGEESLPITTNQDKKSAQPQALFSMKIASKIDSLGSGSEVKAFRQYYGACMERREKLITQLKELPKKKNPEYVRVKKQLCALEHRLIARWRTIHDS